MVGGPSSATLSSYRGKIRLDSGARVIAKFSDGDSDESREFQREVCERLEFPRDPRGQLLPSPGLHQLGGSHWIDGAESFGDSLGLPASVDSFTIGRIAKVQDQGSGWQHGVEIA